MNTGSVASPSPIAEQLATLKTLTQQIREFLLLQDWNAATDLDLKRRGLLAELFDRQAPAADLPALVAGLREVVAMNDELLGLMAHHRRALDREVDLLSNAKRMGKAYLGERGHG